MQPLLVALAPTALEPGPPAPLAVALLAAYLLGSVPFGWVLARVLKGVDLRTIGSGNIGATNAMRVIGRPLGIVAFLLDFAKGAVPILLLGGGDPWRNVALGAAAIAGHVWPVFLRFRGGKAVATSFGAVAAIDPVVALGAGLVWLAVLYLTRFVSLASVATALAFPALALARAPSRPYGAEFVLATTLLAGLIVFRHRSNMSRIRAGVEPRTRLFDRLRPKAAR
jgi:glycerol-3-phosphate acyltransferase PlsY